MIPRSGLRNDSWPTLAAEITTEADFGQHSIGIATRGAFLVSRDIEMDHEGDQHIRSGVDPPVQGTLLCIAELELSVAVCAKIRPSVACIVCMTKNFVNIIHTCTSSSFNNGC